MSILLEKIEISNIRSHKHIVFEPSPRGITTISGPNGIGKSSIVDSFAWALFGTKPPGVSKIADLIRWGIDWDKDQCFVDVVFRIDDGVMRVKRKFVGRGKKVECDVWWKDSSEEEFPEDTVAGPAVSHAEVYIRQRLKMDEAGFLTAVLVQQKQVDKLVSSTAKDRSRVIEKLTGIAAITSALSEARSEQKILQTQANTFDIDEGALDKMRLEHEKMLSNGKRMYESYNKTKEEKEALREDFEALKEKFSAEQEKSETSRDLSRKIVELDASIRVNSERLQELNEEKKKLKRELPVEGASRSLKDIQKDLSNVNRKHLSLLSSIETKKSDLSKKQREAEEANSFIDEFLQKYGDYETTKKNNVLQLKKAEEEIEKSKKTIVECSSQIKRLQKSISDLEGDHGKCPTCLQEVKDLDFTVGVLQSNIDSEQKKIEEAKNQLEEAESEFIDAEKMKDKLNTFSNSSKIVEQASQEVLILREGIESLSADEVVVSREKSIFEKELREAEKIDEKRMNYETMLSRVQKTLRTVENLQREKEAAQEKLDSLKVMSDKSLTALRKKYEVVSQKFQNKQESFLNKRSELKIARMEADHTKAEIDRLEKDVEKYRKLLESVEIMSSTVHVIEEFRQDRIDTVLPAVGAYASELLTRFTEGKFVTLSLDSKFQASVTTADGKVTPVGLLSGGELSAAAIALRLAVSMLFYSNGDQSLICLDEVLVSQDEARSEIILETIKEVCQGQVVLIAHNEGISSIADKVFEIM